MITPEECLKLTQTEEKELAELERHCDTVLRSRFQKPGTTVSVTLGSAYNSKIIDRTIAGYEASGWKVIYNVKGQSYSLEFSERSTTFKEISGYGQG